MSWIAWTAIIGPAVSFGIGWVVGYQHGGGRYAEELGKRAFERDQWKARSEALQAQLRQTLNPISDRTFDRLLREIAASGGND